MEDLRKKEGGTRWMGERPESPTSCFLGLLEKEESEEVVMESLVGLLGLRREDGETGPEEPGVLDLPLRVGVGGERGDAHEDGDGEHDSKDAVDLAHEA